MKNSTVFLLIALLFLACSKNESEDTNPPIDKGVAVRYHFVQNKDTKELISTYLGDKLSIGKVQSFFDPLGEVHPEKISFLEGSRTILFKNNCVANFKGYNFVNTSISQINNVLNTKDFCESNINSIASSNEAFFISYLENESNQFTIKKIPKQATEISELPTSILIKTPIKILYVNNRVFIHTKEEAPSKRQYLVILDANTLEKISEIYIGEDSIKIFKQENNLIVSALAYHIIINTETGEEITQTRYAENGAPNFDYNMGMHFIDNSVFYYRLDNTLKNSPASYNFNTKTTTLYFLDNFIPQQELDLNYAIDKITLVSYDRINDLILIGYKKKNSLTGGVFRLDNSKETKLLDHIKLDYAPKEVYVVTN